MSIVEVFEKFAQQYREEGLGEKTLLFNFLPDFLNEVNEEWGTECSISPALTKDWMFEIKKDGYLKYVMKDSGEISKCEISWFKTGNTVWNGDDEYFKEWGAEYINLKLHDEVNVPKIMTSDSLENLACQIIEAVNV